MRAFATANGGLFAGYSCPRIVPPNCFCCGASNGMHLVAHQTSSKYSVRSSWLSVAAIAAQDQVSAVEPSWTAMPSSPVLPGHFAAGMHLVAADEVIIHIYKIIILK